MSRNLNILAVDTATRGMSVSVFRDGIPVVTRSCGEMRDQAKTLLPVVTEALAAAKIDFSGLDALAAATGPGSFTGIRVGLAAMQGIALASGLPLAGFDNFSLYDASAPDKSKDRLVLLESHRKECFCQLFGKNGDRKDAPFQEDAAGIMACFPEKKNLYLAGNAVTVLRELAAAGYDAPEIPQDFAAENSSVLLGRMLLAAAVEQAVGELAERYPARPFYIRPPDVTMPK